MVNRYIEISRFCWNNGEAARRCNSRIPITPASLILQYKRVKLGYNIAF